MQRAHAKTRIRTRLGNIIFSYSSGGPELELRCSPAFLVSLGPELGGVEFLIFSLPAVEVAIQNESVVISWECVFAGEHVGSGCHLSHIGSLVCVAITFTIRTALLHHIFKSWFRRLTSLVPNSQALTPRVSAWAGSAVRFEMVLRVR